MVHVYTHDNERMEKIKLAQFSDSYILKNKKLFF